MWEQLPYNVVFALVAFVAVLYWFLTKNFNYWLKKGIAGPKPTLIFGNFLDRIFRSQADLDTENVKKFGKIYGIFNGTDPVLHVAEPEIVKQILVKEFHRFNNRRELQTYHPVINSNLFVSRDEEWKKIRTITSSTFTSGKMKKLYGLVRECLQEYLVFLDEKADKGESFDVKKMHESLTMDVIACCAFATKTNAIKDPNNIFIQNCRKIFDMKASKFIPAFVFPKSINRLLNVKSFFDEDANDYIIQMTRHIIERRKANGQKNNDFLQLLIDAKADEREEMSEESDANFYLNNDEKTTLEWKLKFADKTLTENEILGQAWVFLIAGFETSAATLGYMSYELARNPDIQEKLYKELMSAMGSEGEIGYEELHRLPYLDACISETLRLYPPVARLEREANSEFKLGNHGITVHKGQVVEILVYVMHRSEEYFRNAHHFQPDRFLPENRHHIIPYTYMPFGTGPRNCIGMRFALMEIKLAMAHIITRFRFTTTDRTEKEVTFCPLTPMLSPSSLTLAIERR